MKRVRAESFTEVTEDFEDFLSMGGRSQAEVEAELEWVKAEVTRLAAQIPDLEDPINADARAQVASVKASLAQAAVDYLARSAPVVKYVATTQTTTIDIAKERYLDPGRALEIEQLNSIADPLDIPPGTELLIHAY
ncbi:MAG: hypothetical protein GY854_04485 [Deltaproteobacteria bacterium]|nr:hypothetical protein [Deltaproteobacteria bacterium]